MQLGNESETELQQNKEHFVVLYTKKKKSPRVTNEIWKRFQMPVCVINIKEYQQNDLVSDARFADANNYVQGQVYAMIIM